MPAPVLPDHVLAAVILVFDPLYGVWEYRRLVRRVRAGVAEARAAFYRKAMLVSWASVTLLVVTWLAAGRPADALGLAPPEGARLLAGIAITLVGLAVLRAQLRAVSALDEQALAGLRAQMPELLDFVPRTAHERDLFRGLSVTAGVCEEIVFRGYLTWYLAAFVGLWPAVFAAAPVFGLAHAYQGPAGVLKAGLTGLVMGVLFVATGSLLFPIVLHAAIDLQGGAMVRLVLRPEPARADTPA